MDLSTVGGVVEALVATYAAGLDYYTNWQRRKWQENHYQTNNKSSPAGGNACALSTSLGFSSRKIRETFDSGTDILGDGFGTGDERCRGVLQGELEQLQVCVYTLRRALRAGHTPFELSEVIRVSEDVRLSCLAALASQYRRVAVGRLVPLILPGSNRRSRLSIVIPEEDTIKLVDSDSGVNDDEAEYTQSSHPIGGSGKSPYLQSEPPSPPPTPKQIPDDLQSTCTSATSDYGPRPKNSVFSLFCPEALKYQVNPRKIMPTDRSCRCGYNWDGKHTEDKAVLTVNEGFQITPRFLGKSHCEGGFGCVLCTSSGRTETYANVEDLKDHINECHTKWQLLHDQDMAGQ
ncbi:hypothetical protein F5Y04DRAFT_173781 [Hypomontagnella monticulosa]|nr:hypothetical protein F5Y04DRAFT_173781 [Hypomontagnella monticulosa]